MATSLLLERLLSNAAAGPSSVCAREHGTRLGPSRRQSAQALHSSGSASRRGGSLGAASGQVAGGRRRGGAARRRHPLSATTRCQALQAADYSFYQRLREGELNEEFLWETRLLPLLGYLSPGEATTVREALSLAYDAHGGQRRKSGEPFITHPVEVTRILAELKMDYESLVAGLLHDTVEDCGDVVGLDEIEFHFGPAVRRIVEGETKFSKLPTHHPEDRNSTGAGGVVAEIVESNNGSAGSVDPKAQDLQFLFLAMTEEVRIIVVKLADRLHNMRTMASMPPSKQRRIAQETLQVFAPLARLLGLYSIKEELEELSFKYALPTQYDQMRRSVARLWQVQQPLVEAACRELQDKLDYDPYLVARISGVRVETCRKALYSTWRKLNDAGKTPKEIGDIAQLRVLLQPRSGTDAVPLDYGSEKQLCYHVMGLVHTFWAPIPGSMKDYIATPKPNNYQSLHTTVVPTGLDLGAQLNGSNGGSGNGNGAVRRKGQVQLLFPIEVQIRTEEMNRLAENGIAVESWSCADCNGRLRGSTGGGSSGDGGEDSVLGGGLTTSNGDGSSSWEDDEGGELLPPPLANGASSNGLGSINGTATGAAAPGVDAAMRFPFNLGMLVASLGGAMPPEPPGSSSSSTSGGSGDDQGPSSNGASSSNGGAAASSNGSSSSRRNEAVLLSSSREGVLGENPIDPQVLSRRINWLKSIREWQSEFVGTLTASEFVECITDDLLGQSVFVFTPSGEVVRLPKGATVVDFAYHIHTEMGNTMVAAKVNGKVVNADHELQNAEVVEVVRYKGPVNATIIRRHQQWLDAAQTRTARHKIAKFLRQHAAFAVSKGLLPPGSSGLVAPCAPTDFDASQCTWLVLQCDDRPGLLAEVANVIARHQHNITAYSGSADPEAGLFIMEYELEGRPSSLQTLCEELSCIESVSSWAAGCALPEEQQRRCSNI